MRISVITVTYNCHESVVKTIDSVVGQSFTDYEYIIIDGNSVDGTAECVRSYIEKGHNIMLVSEPDNGIYDAMNKAINRATGDYLIFMNAGDSFYNSKTLESFNCYRGKESADIYYGDIIETKDGRNTYRKYGNRLTDFYFIQRNGLCHQAIFAHRKCFDENGFKWKLYPITADKEWIIRSWKKRLVFRHLNFPVCYYDRDGISSKAENAKKIRDESDRIISNWFGIRGKLIVFARRLKNLSRRS